MKIRFALISILVSSITACGGGGGGGGSEPSQPDVFYVRATAGNDANDGMTAMTAFKSISAAIAALTDGDTVIVGPGRYEEMIDLMAPGGLENSPIVFRADPSGDMTSDPPGPVIIDGRRNGSTIRLTNFPYTTFDGFEVTGASGTDNAGILIRTDSHNVTVQNCIVRNNVGDPGDFVHGIRVQDSDDALIFNNLAYDNSGQGIGVLGNRPGSRRARVINNTVVRNNRGISIGTGRTASTDAFLLNNIFQENVINNIRVFEGPPSSLDGYSAQFNLVFPLAGAYDPPTLPHPTDINEDALFVDMQEDNFLLSHTAAGQDKQSPAVNAGSTSGVPGSPVDFPALRLRTTASDGQADRPESKIDLGFHDIAEPAGEGVAYYVRADAGSDSNNGMSPSQAFKTISAGVIHAVAGDVIVVGPGQYNEAIINPPSGEPDRLLTFLGDPTGRLTGDIAGAVMVDGGVQRAAFSFAGAEFIIVDGFTVTGGSEAGIEIRSSSSNLTVRNCVSVENPDNGIRVRDSSNILLFNNLVVHNGGTGILIGGTSGSQDVQAVNNTVANNGDRGIRVGDGSVPTSNVLLQNNLVQNNDSTGIQANNESAESVSALYNLVFPENYFPRTLEHLNDINEDAEFVGADDYYLVQATSPAVDAGDPSTDTALANALSTRTTDPNGTSDMGQVDLGYHYAIP